MACGESRTDESLHRIATRQELVPRQDGHGLGINGGEWLEEIAMVPDATDVPAGACEQLLQKSRRHAWHIDRQHNEQIGLQQIEACGDSAQRPTVLKYIVDSTYIIRYAAARRAGPENARRLELLQRLQLLLPEEQLGARRSKLRF